MQIIQNRRHFLTGAAAAGATGLLGTATDAWAEPAPETTTVRLANGLAGACWAPQFVAQDLLRAEGFTDVRYVVPDWDKDMLQDTSVWMARGEIDFDWQFVPVTIAMIEAGMPIKVVTGLHSGCLELIVNESINSIADLKGKRVGVFALTSAPHVLVTLMAAFVGLDPATDLEWVANPDVSSMQLFNEGKVDAFLAVPPEPQEQRVRNFGHTILNTTADRPWSQHYCCMLACSADYVDRHPAATKRVLRAILKAADICASDPELAAQLSVDGKFTDRYDYALEGLREARYDVWREFDPEDTMRFYALRMNEVGFIKAGPNKIIANGTDWRFLNEIKREMKT
ncbi:ABC transporter substrate-binding protein [Mesorhizobium newzealandense]|uniref:ABC transporter substrate-binding protein n=1 Tax=Mesorhizobium newzealandense TaxID=1300302 RepID=A0ABW4UBG9_9HYPH